MKKSDLFGRMNTCKYTAFYNTMSNTPHAKLERMSKSGARLFQQFQPSAYDLWLEPDRRSMTFKGSVVINGKKTGRPSQRITLHGKGLRISAATITKHDKKGEQPLSIDRINPHKSFDEVRLHSKSLLYPGEYTIRLEFSGTITRGMTGLYPCFFDIEGTEHSLLMTQLESHHARELFPCIDEPEAKATFDLTLVTEPGLTVLSTTPVKRTESRKSKVALRQLHV